MNPTGRFSSRVGNYARYRPDYPPEVVAWLVERCALGQESVIADVGSGTGIFTRMLLCVGCAVYGVEPNAEMRGEAERSLAGFPNFHSVAATAEATGLAERSVDLVTAAQAAHWFDVARMKQELGRILKPGGRVALIWNVRRTGSTPFLREYEELLKRRGVDYAQVNAHQGDETRIRELFGARGYEQLRLDHAQHFDAEGLLGRALSSSYTPEPGHTGYEPMLAELRELFERHQTGGRVTFEYDTRVYLSAQRRPEAGPRTP